ncbi:MAG: aminopeptidase [Deltaproteobacteria bacterium]|nr:aminopeptidase [Deltaproteobacteria bacterium]
MLKDRLILETSRVWDKLNAKERAAVFEYAKEYRGFLDRARTERRAAAYFVETAAKRGFVELGEPKPRATGLYQLVRGKSLAMAVPGKRPMTDGIRLIASHTDCPRLDLKPNPLYEDTDLALLKTHYYGGVKKYQWVARSLALVGTVILANGDRVDVEIGLAPGDPIFVITDLLPHLGKKQMEKKANEFIPAENLNPIVGGLPYSDKDSDQRVKLAIMELLNSKYQLTEEDFTTAELQVVPAEPARDAGLDRSMIAGYGQDDRICAYTSFTALMETKRPTHTAVAIFYDKEEIGSEGNTGAQSRFLEMFLMDLMEGSGIEPSFQNLNRVFANAKALSADVNAALDPTYSDVFEKRNACKMGSGVTMEKYSGHGGKYMTSDANAEYAAWVRRLFNDHGIVWQTGGQGKVDEGGGGTVAKFLAKMGMDVIDMGPPLLSMHSPLEIAAKDDLWMCHRAFTVFFAS